MPVGCRLLLNCRLGITGGYSEIINRLRRRSLRFDWRGWLLVGVILGASGYALAAGGPDFHGYGWLTVPLTGSDHMFVAPILLAAGVLIGYGAKRAGGLHVGQRAERQRDALPLKPRRNRDLLRHRDRRQLHHPSGRMSTRLAGLTIGTAFGVVLSWSGMTSPVIIRQALLFQRAYLFLFFASAVVVATIGLHLLRRMRLKALITREPIDWPTQPLQRRHMTGSIIFGLGWGIADACPGPIATQLGQGIAWGLPTLAGVIIGVHLFLRHDQPDTEPAAETPQLAPGGARTPRGISLT